MDLPNIETYLRLDDIQTLTNWSADYAWLAGGTWLFSEPQTHLKTLIDIQTLGWSEIEVNEDYLIIGATCPLVKLLEYPWLPEWTAAEGLKSAVTALAASLKVINVATVGGNICLALSVGTLAPVMVALGAIYEIWNIKGESHQVAAKDFQIGSRQTILQPGEILRRVLIPLSHLQWKVNYQRFSIAATDPALVIVVTARNEQQINCVISASIAAPLLWRFDNVEAPNFAFLQKLNFITDAKASSDYRREVTVVLIKRTLQ
ncbi:FAD binding domain-containing protein [Nostoc sp. UHCC 0302]|uniref:FAD binding domain-containing protein n=1 Tax=Nostoc sp. UHCC 0302 TaxID=3134896 RepID=UPI00311C9405